MIINDAGRKIIETFETCQLKAYLCPAGRWTIGYGHTGKSVVEGLTITQHQADVILESDLMDFETCVGKFCPKLNANQFSACVSLAFNIGAAAFSQSTLVKRCNAGAFLGAAEDFLKWDKAHVNGEMVTLPGLLKRRTAERALFLTGVS